MGTPQWDGVAKWINQIMLERAMCMLSSAGLEKRFWAEVVNTACYLINLGPHTGIECRIPSELQDDHEVIDVQEVTKNQEERVEDVQLESTETQRLDATERSIAKGRPRRVDVRPPEK
ncbi:hypothetical protein YC2023_089394 [Brassica napus]